MTKVRDYALNPTHPEGKHKARVFAAALGIGASHTEWLIGELRKAALDTDCIGGRQDEHGQRYIVEFAATHHGKTARLRSVWILRPTENSPRLVSC